MFGLTTEIKKKEAERLLFLGENMADWKNININKNLIIHDTGKSTLIAMPHKSDYDGWEFWFPSKLVREAFNRKDAMNIGYNDDFIFHLKKYDTEKDINVKEFERAFCVVAGNIDAWILKHLGMDAEELLRLKQISGLASLFADKEFSKAWEV